MTARSFSAASIVTVLLIVAVVWWTHDGGNSASAPSAAAATAATAPAQTRLSASSVLDIDMTKSSSPVRAASASPTLAREAEQSNNLKAIYDRISGSPASLSDANPQKAIRLKAFDDMRRCQGMENVTTSKAELDKLLDDAARDGDPRARALQVQREMGGDTPRGTAPITDAQLRTLQEAIASRDAAAIAIAGTVLSNTFADMVIEVGDQHEPLDPRAAHDAWTLLACEYGLDCGPNNNDLRQSCALSGRCGPSSLPDYIFYYETTPSQAQLVDQYRRYFRQAIDTNDWSTLSFARRPNQPDSVFRFYTAGP